jgi:hypothetical protein
VVRRFPVELCDLTEADSVVVMIMLLIAGSCSVLLYAKASERGSDRMHSTSFLGIFCKIYVILPCLDAGRITQLDVWVRLGGGWAHAS